MLFRINTLLGGKGVDEIVFRIAPSDVSRANPRVAVERPKDALVAECALGKRRPRDSAEASLL